MTLHEYLEVEQKLPELDEIEIRGVPIWRIVRTTFRWRILDSYPFSVKKNIEIVTQLKNNHRSFIGLMKLMMTRRKANTVFFPHPRLYLVNDLYVERMSDPLIDYSEIGKDYLILERHQNGLHREPRIHMDKVVYLDFIDNVAKAVSPVKKYIDGILYRKYVDKLIGVLAKEYQFDHDRMRYEFIEQLSSFLTRRSLIAPVLSCLRPKQVFLAPRQTYQYVIAHCKAHDITTIELQHGVTVGETELYSGDYNEHIDPDFFGAFGKANVGLHFGMPLERVVNLGFPYKKYINSLGLDHFEPSVVLAISEPRISKLLVELLISFVEYYPDLIFHIRCHPQERFSSELMARIEKYSQILVVDNKLESFCALSQYESVIGENSTVLYEAMSMGKKVGRLNYGGFHVKETEMIHGGTKLNSHEDLIHFVKNEYSSDCDAKEVYSDFQLNTLNKIIK